VLSLRLPKGRTDKRTHLVNVTAQYKARKDPNQLKFQISKQTRLINDYTIEKVLEVTRQKMKISEVPIEIKFKTMPTVIVTYDPQADVTPVTGQGGKTYYNVPVQMDGHAAILPVSGKLLQLLSPIKQPTKLKITRTGESFNTNFTVEPVR
jgi:hypothetical protein